MEASFRNRVLATLLLASLGVLTLVAVLGYGVMLLNLHDRSISESDLALEASSSRAEQALDAAVEDLKRLSRFPPLVNGLTDTEERKGYLEPALRASLERSAGLLRLSLVDHRARPLGAVGTGASAEASAPLAQEAMASGQPKARLEGSPDRPILIAAFPVVYPPTGSAEGALVAEVDLDPLLLPVHVLRSSTLELEYRLPASASAEGRDSLLERRKSLAVSPPPDSGASLWLVARLRAEVFRDAFWRWTAAFGIGAALLSLLAFLVSRRLADALSEPLERLTRVATEQRDADERGPTPEPMASGPHEIRRLSEAFSELISELRGRNRLLGAQVDAETAQALRRENQLAAVLNLAKDGFAVVGPGGRVEYVNAAFESLTGIDSWRVVGKGAQDLLDELRGHAAPGSSWPAALGSASEPPRQREGGRADEGLLRLSLPLPAYLAATVWRSDMRAGAFVIHLRDVTRETELEQLKNQFLATAAHELRTPLASISGFAQLLREQAGTDELAAEAVRQICDQCDALSHLLDDLLDLEAMESGQGRVMVRDRLDAAALLRAAVAMYRPPEGRTPPAVPPALPALVVLGDEARLRQAIGNLLSNAYKYSPPTSMVRVSVLEGAWVEPGWDAAKASGFAGLRVEDEGIGMSAAQRKHAFERFWRADPTGVVPGTGLGLSIVREIVERHGGRVELDSEPGRGTAVTLWIPLAPPT